MKKLFFILISCFFLFPGLASAACPDTFPAPQIEFSASYGKLHYITYQASGELTKIAEQKGIVEKGIFASGLSTINVHMDTKLNTIGDIVGEYDFCVYPTTVKISVFFSEPTIYLASELVPNTCKYNVVLRHEQTHQQINKSALDYFLPLFQEAARQISYSIKPQNVSSLSGIDEASEQLNKEYNQKLTPLFEFFKQQIQAEHLKLDNQSNYLHEKMLCR